MDGFRGSNFSYVDPKKFPRLFSQNVAVNRVATDRRKASRSGACVDLWPDDLHFPHVNEFFEVNSLEESGLSKGP